MRKFTPVLQSLLEDRYEDKSNTSIMNINYIGFQMFDRITQQLFESYDNMKILVINHCDLRNLENFPKLLCLTDLNLANNSLQGSFNNIMKCKKLSYMDISCNLILDVSKLQPLRKIPHLSLYLKNNPFTERQGWNLKIKSYKLKIIKDPKKFPNEEKSKQKQKQKQKNKIKNECKLEDKKQKLIQEISKQEKIEKNKQQINIINIQPEANQGLLKDIDQNQQPFKDIQMLIKTDLFNLNNPGNIFLHKNILDDNSENDQLKEINHFEHFSQHDDQDDLINDGDEDIDEDDDSIDDDNDDDDISLDDDNDDNDEQQQQY